MVTVDEYARVRRSHFVDGLGIRELVRRFHHSRRKIREILVMPEPKRYVPAQAIALDPGPFQTDHRRDSRQRRGSGAQAAAHSEAAVAAAAS
jgi:hypothetical protein